MTERVQVNSRMEKELYDLLQRMAEQDQGSISALIRRLIVQEWARRQAEVKK